MIAGSSPPMGAAFAPSPMTPAGHLPRTDARPPSLEDVQGLWRREWLRSPDGGEDDSTEVWWLQAGALHVDMRLPLGGGGAHPLHDTNAHALRLAARAEGFAGVTTIERGVCTWTRRVNWRGPLEGQDVGALFFEDGGLVERGVFADYTELWRRAPQGEGVLEARQLRRADGQLAVLARAGDVFMLGRGAPESLAATGDLRARLDLALEQRHRAAVRRLFDMEFCLGRLTRAGGVIRRSTLPGREGTLAFGPGSFDSPGVLLQHRPMDDGDPEMTDWLPV